MTETATPVLSVRNLRVEFPLRRGTLTAVDDLSFDIAAGEVLGVVGESGAGKSLTGAAVIGLLEPPGRIGGGEVRLHGERIDNLPPSRMRKIRGRHIGMVFQDPLTSLNPLFTIGEQLVETIVTHTGMGGSAARRRAIDLLAEVGIPAPADRVDSYPHQFSGGMRQRAVIALALCAEPQLVIADEPTTALDVSVQAQILNLLLDLKAEFGLTYLFISHDLSVVESISDRVAVMYFGRIFELGTRDQVFSDALHPYTHLLLNSAPAPGRKAVSGGDREAELPDPYNPPPGCAFFARCQSGTDACRRSVPPIDEAMGEAGHKAACFHPMTKRTA